MTNIIIRDVAEDEVDGILEGIAEQYGLWADTAEDGEFV